VLSRVAACTQECFHHKKRGGKLAGAALRCGVKNEPVGGGQRVRRRGEVFEEAEDGMGDGRWDGRGSVWRGV
jgi:hypothetical protein